MFQNHLLWEVLELFIQRVKQCGMETIKCQILIYIMMLIDLVLDLSVIITYRILTILKITFLTEFSILR